MLLNIFKFQFSHINMLYGMFKINALLRKCSTFIFSITLTLIFNITIFSSFFYIKYLVTTITVNSQDAIKTALFNFDLFISWPTLTLKILLEKQKINPPFGIGLTLKNLQHCHTCLQAFIN